ncbi:hypothetical protein [Prochlorococcus marinus]|uniref:hypothetical protein n=1 Tax=Prochlorococcus TaxID=1218 RepID=UPI0007B342B3|nr:hypothetical protein [Prochlorococcus marinus]
MKEHIQKMEEMKILADGEEIAILDILDRNINDIKSQYENAMHSMKTAEEILPVALGLIQASLAKEFYLNAGGKILEGVFKGMNYLPVSLGSVLIPKLLGTYENKIAKYLSKKAESSDHFLEIGCAEGYYVAGLAYKCHNLYSSGVDIDPSSVHLASLLCSINGLTQRTTIESDLEKTVHKLSGNTLVLIDVDGGEINIIRKFLTFANQNKNINTIILVVETDLNLDGTSNAEEIKILLLSNIFEIKETLHHDIKDSFSSLTKSMSDINRFACAHERGIPNQSWIIAEYQSDYPRNT